MISSKILVQSAAAGLMAGAILMMPLFVFGPDDASSERRTCPYRTSKVAVDLDETRTAHFEPPMLRAAPAPSQADRGRAARSQVDRAQIKEQLHEQSRRELRQYRRSLVERNLAERNRAANRALQKINRAYQRSDAHRLGAEAAHTVRIDALNRP